MIIRNRSTRSFFLLIILMTVNINISENVSGQLVYSDSISENQVDTVDIYYTYGLYDNNDDGLYDAITVDLTIEYDLAYENYFSAAVSAYLSIDNSISIREDRSLGTYSTGNGFINEIFDLQLIWDGDYQIRVSVWKGGYYEMDEFFDIYGIAGVADPSEEWVDVNYKYEVQDSDHFAGNDSIMVWLDLEYNTLAPTHFSFSVDASPVLNPSIILDDWKDSSWIRPGYGIHNITFKIELPWSGDYNVNVRVYSRSYPKLTDQFMISDACGIGIWCEEGAYITYDYDVYDIDDDTALDHISMGIKIEYNTYSDTYFQTRLTATWIDDPTIIFQEDIDFLNINPGNGTLDHGFDLFLPNEGTYEVRIRIWQDGDYILDETFEITEIGIRDPEFIDISYTVNSIDQDDYPGDEGIELKVSINYFLWEESYFEVKLTMSEVDNSSNHAVETYDVGTRGSGKGILQATIVMYPNLRGDCELKFEVWRSGVPIYDDIYMVYDFGINTDEESDTIDTGPTIPLPLTNIWTIIFSLFSLTIITKKKWKT